jgi:hypothetical protein
MKKTWQKPKLVILVRTNPEEAVLSLCKMPGNFGGLAASISPAAEDAGCYWEVECNDCSELSFS